MKIFIIGCPPLRGVQSNVQSYSFQPQNRIFFVVFLYKNTTTEWFADKYTGKSFVGREKKQRVAPLQKTIKTVPNVLFCLRRSVVACRENWDKWCWMRLIRWKSIIYHDVFAVCNFFAQEKRCFFGEEAMLLRERSNALLPEKRCFVYGMIKEKCSKSRILRVGIYPANLYNSYDNLTEVSDLVLLPLPRPQRGRRWRGRL